MKKTRIGVVNYGMGNLASVIHTLTNLKFKVVESSEIRILKDVDILLIPGVGAFPNAMRNLQKLGLVNFLQQQAHNGKPIIGICLGMQLLASSSQEFAPTQGLDLIPGEIKPLSFSRWHIGWNKIHCIKQDELLSPSNEHSFYFNHSFTYLGPKKYQVCVSQHIQTINSVIRNDNVIGIQFHPEKSQEAGRILLNNLIRGVSFAQ